MFAQLDQPIFALGVLNGGDMPASRLAEICGPFAGTFPIYATDGAADRLRVIDVIPQVIIGDFDSISDMAAWPDSELVHIADQDTSDCDKLLNLLSHRGFEAVTLANVEGDRPDHFLATLSSCAQSSLKVFIQFRRGFGKILRGASHESFTEVKPGTTISVIPITICEGVALTGVHWPLEAATLEPGGSLSLSNLAIGGNAELQIQSGVALFYMIGDVT